LRADLVFGWRQLVRHVALGARPSHVVTRLTTRLAGMVVLGAIPPAIRAVRTDPARTLHPSS
jgi:hypothetical protein